LHTPDTSGNGVAILLEAARAGVDAVDAALSSMSGTTSQPSLNALVTALEGTARDTGLSAQSLQKLADYWEIAREPYSPFECGLKAGTADVYRHEMPGGQYSNFRSQAISVGLGDRWEDVKEMYREVNLLCGDIIKVTPSSKAVGDMALFMVQNNLNSESVIAQGKDLAFPDSIVSMMKGMMGQPPGGWPPALQKAVLKDEEPITCRPGELLEDFDFDEAARKLKAKFGRDFNELDLLSYAMYPKVYQDYCSFQEEFGEVAVLDTPTFLYGLKGDEEVTVTIEEGKNLIVKMVAVGELQPDGTRILYFELNGRRRIAVARDKHSGVVVKVREKADPSNPNQVGAPMAGKVVELHVKAGDNVKEGQSLAVTEAMKMLNVVKASRDGKIARVTATVGDSLKAGELILELT
jgi:pyruvate carboxylase